MRAPLTRAGAAGRSNAAGAAARWLALGLLATTLSVATLRPAHAEAGAALSADEIDRRLSDIERVHVELPWQQSQRMIDALRRQWSEPSVAQRARLDLIEARNRLLDDRYREGLALLEDLLGRPVSANQRGRALELAGNASLYLQNYDRAFEYLTAALRLADEIDDLSVRQGIFSVAARLHTELGESSLALRYAAENRALAERSGKPRDLCDAWITLVEAQRSAGLLAVAQDSAPTLWQVCQRAGDPVLFGGALLLIGSLELSAGRPDSAIGWLERALRQNREAGFEAGARQAALQLGRALVDRGQGERGRELLLPLTDVFERTQQWGDAHALHLALADAFAASGEHAAALAHLDRARRAWDRLNDAERAHRLAYLQADFELQRQRQELELLRQQDRLNELRQRNADAQRTARVLGAVAAGVIVVLLVALLIRFRRDRRRFRKLSEVDGLTGLYNHRQFHQKVARSMDESSDAHGVCSLIAADVDLFKQINDRYGHRAGDDVLRWISALLREHFPPPCIVGRVGGEEFAVYLPGFNRLQAQQRIRALVDALGPVSFEDHTIEFTLSFGLVESRARSERLERLRSRADRALYRAKRAGRNQIVDGSDANGD
jgi:diguanylate cyclase (GGDEF)-like protein